MKIKAATPADLARIEAAARADHHAAFAPTHLMENDAGEVRGYFSTDGCAIVMFWSHVGNVPLASIRLVNESKSEARKLGKPVFYPCDPKSPFAPLLPRLGFELVGNANFWKLKE